MGMIYEIIMICNTKSQATEKTEIAIYEVLDCKKSCDPQLEIETFRDSKSALITLTQNVDSETSNGLSFHEYQQKEIKKIMSKIGMKFYTIGANVHEFEGKYTTSLSMHFKTGEI